jgi:hypothetical protein
MCVARAVRAGVVVRVILAMLLSVAGWCGEVEAQTVTTGLAPGSCGTFLWDSGAFDRRTAQTSEVGAYVGDIQIADDVYVRPWEVWRVDRIMGVLVGDSIVPKARVRVYEDCNGEPSTLVYSQDTTMLTDTGQVYEGRKVWLVQAAATNLWRSGGASGKTYWVSIVGIQAQTSDEWYWGSAATVMGKPGEFKGIGAGYPNWVGVDQLGCGCTDFALRIEGECCKVLWDNGAPLTPEAGTLSMVGPGSVTRRRAHLSPPFRSRGRSTSAIR